MAEAPWRHTFGLCYVPADEVGDAFVELIEEKPNDERVNRYADYLTDTYIQQDAIFPPFIWAAATAALTRTTNACESFHSRLNGSFYAAHPNIYIFLEKLRVSN